jgi:hypothetical protein
MAPTFTTDDASDVHDVLLPGAHTPAVDSIVCRSTPRDHAGCVSREGRAVQRESEARAGSLGGRNVMEVDPRRQFRLPCSCEGVGVYFVPGPDEVPSQLHLLSWKAAGEVEVGVDECDPHQSVSRPWQPSAVMAALRKNQPISPMGTQVTNDRALLDSCGFRSRGDVRPTSTHADVGQHPRGSKLGPGGPLEVGPPHRGATAGLGNPARSEASPWRRLIPSHQYSFVQGVLAR